MVTPTVDRAATLGELHRGLTQRPTPQHVAQTLLNLDIEARLNASAAAELRTLAGHNAYWRTGSSMTAKYRRHPGLHRAYTDAANHLQTITTAAGLWPLADADPTDPESLNAWLDLAHDVLGLDQDTSRPARKTSHNREKTVTYPGWGGAVHTYTYPRRPRGRRGDTGGHADARTRLTASERRDALPGVSARTYRKAVRAVLHLAQRTDVLAGERDREAAIAYGKSRLAYTISAEDFAACDLTAAFVAYYTARLGMRTQFTSGPQDRPMDTVAQALLDAALAAPTCRPDVIARVLTRQKVLRRLTDTQKGQLLAATYQVLLAAARTLRSGYDPARKGMVVRQGDDSTSWNAASRAFNQARTGLLNLTAALDLRALTEASCPGKVPALVAADVAHWHAVEGGSEHVDIGVFAELPKPWDVVLDGADCSADLVRAVCSSHGIDADGTGWTQAYRQGDLADTVPAPDLVHGCVVLVPQLATVLRKAGWFSGQA